jgi:hypothetical protein
MPNGGLEIFPAFFIPPLFPLPTPMKKISVVLSLCLLAIAGLFWQFRTKEAAHETYYHRTITGEYVSQQTQKLDFVPGSLVLAHNRLYAVSSQLPTVGVYDLQLRPLATLHFPPGLRALLSFSVQGDTAYALDGTQTLAALSLSTQQCRVRHLKALGFSRFIRLSQQAYLLKGSHPEQADEDVFKVVNTRTGKPSQVHDVIHRHGDHGMNSDGFFVQGSNGLVYSVSYLNSTIYTFSAAGEYLGQLHTIGNANRTYEVQRMGSYYTFGEPTLRLNLAGGADSLLYLYSRVRSTTPKKYPHEGYLDTYSPSRHAYVGSLRVRRNSPIGFNGLALKGDTLLTAEGKHLVLYTKQPVSL